jgi:hypothetical protein
VSGDSTWYHPPDAATKYHTAGRQSQENKDEKKYYPIEGHWTVKFVRE